MNLNNESYRKQLIPIVVSLFISLLFVSLSTIHFFDPLYVLLDKTTTNVRGSLYSLGKNVADYGTVFSNAHALLQENMKLKEQISSLQSQLADKETLSQENIALKGQLGITTVSQKHLLFSQIISRSVLYDTIVINKGADDGVSVNDVVVSGNNLLGHVSNVNPDSSTIELTTDKDSSIPVYIANTNIQGILDGSVSAGLSMDEILPDANVPVHSIVYTSGLGEGIYPINLVAGTVESIQPVSSSPFKSAKIVPASNSNDLIYVFVIKK